MKEEDTRKKRQQADFTSGANQNISGKLSIQYLIIFYSLVS